MTDTPNNNDKGTIRADGEIVSSGVAPSVSNTQRGASPIIKSGVSPASPVSNVIASGIPISSGGDVILNNKNYKLLKTIAKSTGEAEVYLVENSGQMYVFKYYYPNFKPKETILKQLKDLHHEDIVSLVDYGYYQERFFEILDYAEGGTLADINDAGQYKYLPIKNIPRLKKIVSETVNALNFCHSKGIVHRDIKPGNIFFKNPDGMDVLIGDFGISSMLDEGFSKHMTGQARTEVYAAPDLYQSIGGKTIISKELDYYALGITLLHAWTGEEPFKELSPLATMRIKCDGKVYLPEDMPEDIKTLIKGLITIEPSKRWGYDEVRRWLNGEQVLVHYEAGVIKYSNFNFGIINGENIIVNDPAELAKILEKYPEQGRKHLYKGTISQWLKDINQALYLQIEAIVEDDYPQEEDAGLTKAIYVLDAAKSFRTNLGVECATAEAIGDAIEHEADYYKPLLTQRKNPQLFLYLEARGGKNEVNAFRKYAQTFNNPERAFTTIVLELQGKDKFKSGNFIAYKPTDLLSADEKIKTLISQMLINQDSKIALWLEQFPEYKKDADRSQFRKEIIGSIVNPDTPIVKRYKNEEKLFALLREERSANLNLEKSRRIRDVVEDISQRVDKRKAEGANNYSSSLDYMNHAAIAAYGIIAGGIFWCMGLMQTLAEAKGTGDKIFGIILWVVFILAPFSAIGWGIAWVLGKIACSIWKVVLIGQIGMSPAEENEYVARVNTIETDTAQKLSEDENEIRANIYDMTDLGIENTLKEYESDDKEELPVAPTCDEIARSLPARDSGPANQDITAWNSFIHIHLPVLITFTVLIFGIYYYDSHHPSRAVTEINRRGPPPTDRKTKSKSSQVIKKIDTNEVPPTNAVEYANRGNAYAIKGEYDKAIKYYSKAIELNPKFAEAYADRGYAYVGIGEYSKSIKDTSTAKKLNPKVEAYLNRRR